MSEQNEARLAELSQFLTASRARLKPEDVGLVTGGRRRVPGLRRHEVADLASMSVTWYTWLEQGRPVRSTPQSLDALSRALKLDDDGRRHLRHLGGLPDTSSPESPTEADPDILALLEDLNPSPAYISTPAWDFLGWNDAWKVVFLDPSTLPLPHRNGLWMTFMDERMRSRMMDWESDAAQSIARRRSILAGYPGDHRSSELRDELLGCSDEFRQIWARNEIQEFRSRFQRIRHPEVGDLHFNVIQFRPAAQPALMMTIRRHRDTETLNRVHSLLDSSRSSS